MSRFLADLHVHSKYSRACSRDCDLEHLAWWAARKGVRVVGTGDFTHPAWAEEIATKLVPAEAGLFRLRPELEADVLRTLPASCRTATRFMISTEISTIYKRGDKTRKVHHLLYAPDRETAGRITASLAKIGNLTADGRPILGLDSRHLLEITLSAGEGAYLVPAHVWTPWFAVLGSKSGFDAIEDCYGDLAAEVFALETGLSADPEMFWRISGLDRYRLVSNSDAHSPPMLGREATAFDCAPDYFAMADALRTGNGFAGTVEFFPEEGKYHLDGHRACGVRLEPEQTRELDGRCPQCGRPLTVGVLNRVGMLADRPGGHRPETAGEVRSYVALPEIVGEILGVGPKSKSVASQVTLLTARLGPELGILGEVPLDAIGEVGSSALVEAISRLRAGRVIRDAGFDGEYGVIKLFEPDELLSDAGTLFDLAPASASAGGGSGRGKGSTAARRRSALTAGALEAGALEAGALEAGASGAPPGVPPTAPAPVSSAQPPLADLNAPVTAGAAVLDGLDPDQRRAASVGGGPLLVVAGPGTGKTATLVRSVAHRVVEGEVAASNCLAVTFTRRAAEELTRRLAAVIGDSGADRVLATTFHGLGLAIVREQATRLARDGSVGVADDAVRRELLRDAVAADVTPARLRRLAKEISDLKRARALGRTAATGGGPTGELSRYDALLRARGLVDFDDLMTLPLSLLRNEPEIAEGYRRRFGHVWVDEYQDVDEVQYSLLRLLCPPEGNICAIGDPDQAIYAFRGSDVGFFLRFTEDFPTARTVTLTRNYRSTATIVAAATAAVAPTSLVGDRELRAVGNHGWPDVPVVSVRAGSETQEAVVVADLIEEALGGTSFHAVDTGVHPDATGRLSFSDVAVLYRTARQAAPVVDVLARRGLPFQCRSHQRVVEAPASARLLRTMRAQADGGPSVRTVSGRLRAAAASVLDDLTSPHVEVHDELDELVASENLPPDARAPVTGTPDAGAAEERTAEARITEADVRLAVDLLAPLAAEAGDDLSAFWTATALAAEVDVADPRAEAISLLTMHAAKGLEFGLVIVIGCDDGLLPLRWGAGAVDEAAQAEERRLFFVAMTRARGRLVLTGADRRRRAGALADVQPSQFLADLPAHLVERRAGGSRARGGPAGRQLRLL